METRYKSDEWYAMCGEELNKLNQIKERLYDGKTISYDERRIMAKILDSALGLVVSVKHFQE